MAVLEVRPSPKVLLGVLENRDVCSGDQNHQGPSVIVNRNKLLCSTLGFRTSFIGFESFLGEFYASNWRTSCQQGGQFNVP